jgi:hypothetical protein
VGTLKKVHSGRGKVAPVEIMDNEEKNIFQMLA